MKPIKHYVIFYSYLSPEGEFTIKLTTSRYWLFIKELRRIQKTYNLFILDYCTIKLLKRITFEQKIINYPLNADGLPY